MNICSEIKFRKILLWVHDLSIEFLDVSLSRNLLMIKFKILLIV
jgi:hypothetical protein